MELITISLAFVIYIIFSSRKITKLKEDIEYKNEFIKAIKEENETISNDYRGLYTKYNALRVKRRPVVYDEIEKFIDENPIKKSTIKEISQEMHKDHEELKNDK